MNARRAFALCCAAAFGFVARSAGATGFTDIGQDILPREESHVEVHGYLRTRGNTIEAGTSEVQRNIIGHFVLGLPRSY